MPKPKKKSKSIKKKKKTSYINGSSFTEKELKTFSNVLRKIRKGRRGTKGKKVGITNMSSFMNLLYNAGQERQYAYNRRRYYNPSYGGYRPRQYRPRYYRRSNMMRAHPFKYPSMIENADVNHIWNATKLPRGSKSKDAIISDLNQVYKQLVGFNLLKSPMPAVGSINVVGPDAGIPKKKEPKGPYLMPSKPGAAPPIREAPKLPSKPSAAPPPPISDDESSEDEEF